MIGLWATLVPRCLLCNDVQGKENWPAGGADVKADSNVMLLILMPPATFFLLEIKGLSFLRENLDA